MEFEAIIRVFGIVLFSAFMGTIYTAALLNEKEDEDEPYKKPSNWFI